MTRTEILEEVKGDDRHSLSYKRPLDVLKSRIWEERFVTDYGDFLIPADVPRHFRKDGWFDGRYKRSVAQVRAYFKSQEERLRDELPIQSYADWLQSSKETAA